MKKYRGALIDLDGVIYNDSALIPGAVESVQWLNANGIPYRFITNTTMRSRDTLVQKLTDFGIPTDRNHIFTAAYAAAAFVRENAGASCFPLLLEDARTDYEDILTKGDSADYVVVGDMGDAFTYDLLNKAFLHLQNGAELVAVQKNRYWLSDDGFKLDAGPFVALLEYAARKQAILIGKPARLFFETALKDLRLPATNVLMIGDDLESDIAGAARIQAATCLVRTGKFRQVDLDASPVRPDMVLDSIADLPASNCLDITAPAI